MVVREGLSDQLAFEQRLKAVTALAMKKLGRASQEQSQPSTNPKAELCSAQEVIVAGIEQ